MTDLYHGQLTDLLQNSLRSNPDVIAISYAIQQEKQRLLRLEAKTRTLSMIDDLDEDILDVLAVELRIPYYSQGYTLENKRVIVKTAMLWFYKAGTVEGLLSALRIAHSDSDVEEWYQYGGEPGYFRIGIGITDPNENLDLKWLTDIVNAYKPVRAHLEDGWIAFRSVPKIDMGCGFGFVVYDVPRCGTLPTPAQEGGMGGSSISILTFPEFIAYETPKTGAAVTGTHPNAAEQGASGGSGLRAAIATESVAYSGPVCGESKFF